MSKSNKLGLSRIDNGVQKSKARIVKLPSLQLDLSSIVRDENDSLLTENGMRQIKLAKYTKEISQVAQHIFVSGDQIANDKNILHKYGITHIINCSAYSFQNQYQSEIQYLTLFLYDSPHEDLKCVLYDCFDFVENALMQNSNDDIIQNSWKNNVLIHCSQGVSRSVTIASAYLMWKQDKKYDVVFDEVKQSRGIANPNPGFVTQLLQMQKIWKQYLKNGDYRMYRIAPHCQAAATRLVPKPVIFYEKEQQTQYLQNLDSRLVCIFQTEKCLYIWKGKNSILEFEAAAEKFSKQLIKYEKNQNNIVHVYQGEEPKELIQIVNKQKLQSGIIARNLTENYDAEFEWYFSQIKNQQEQKVLYDSCDESSSDDNSKDDSFRGSYQNSIQFEKNNSCTTIELKQQVWEDNGVFSPPKTPQHT